MKKLLALLAIILLGTFSWYFLSLRPVNAADASRKNIKIESGMSVNAIAAMLQEKQIVRSARAFSLYVRFHNAESSIQAGDFVLQPLMTVEEIVRTLNKGYSEEVTITIPEGYTVKDIDALLVKKELIKDGEFLACAQTCDFSGFSFLPQAAALAKRGGKVEGYLFPDTYFVIRDGFTPEKFLIRLLGTFRTRVVEGLKDDITASKRSLHDIVTMASLIEEETRTNDERAIISGILWKRFRENVGLGVDATVRYIVEKPTAAITLTDLDIDSAYNLRKYRGLPPGPIANSGLESIKAALYPEESKYWYYLHGKDGQIRYAETNDGHNRNKRLYLYY